MRNDGVVALCGGVGIFIGFANDGRHRADHPLGSARLVEKIADRVGVAER